MDATILYEMLHCLVCMVLACWLIQKTLHVPGYPALYAVTVAVVCLFLGDVYWLAHLMIRGSTPVILSACDAAYLGFWLILNAGLPRAAQPEKSSKAFAALMVVFILLNCIGWMVWTSSWLINLLWAIPLMLIAVRSALRTKVDLSSRIFALYALLLGALMVAETFAFLLPAVHWEKVKLLCSLVWLLSLVQFIRLLKGKGTLAQLAMPGRVLILVYCECASFLCTGVAYNVFQLLMLGFLAYFARSVSKEGEACHAL